jgi:PAS domain S-box-containing protein
MSTPASVDYKQLFSHLPDKYFVIEPQPPYTFLAANEAYATMVDKPLDKIIGRPLFDVFPDLSEQAIKTGKGDLELSFERCIQTKKPDAMDIIRYDIPNPDDQFEIRYWQVTHYPVLDRQNKVIAILQAPHDITAMVTTRKQLHLSQQALEGVLSAGLVGSWAWNMTTDIVTADKGLSHIFDIPFTKVAKGLPLATFISSIHPDDRTRVQAAIEAAIKSGEGYECEYRILTKKGTERWVIARGRVERDSQGHPANLPGVVIDITDRKQAELVKKHGEDSLRFMADAMPQLVWVASADGTIEYYNQQWYDFIGAPHDELDAKRMGEAVFREDYPAVQKSWRKSLKEGTPYEIEYRLYHADTKSYRWVMGRALPYKDEAGIIQKWYGTCTDIDTHKRTSQIQTFLAEASKELAQSLDYVETLKKVSKLCVPEVADWFSVDLYSEVTGWDQVSVAHVDPKKVNLAREYRKVNPINVDDPGGVPKVVRTGESEFYPYLDENLIKQYMEPGENRDFMLSLNIHSIIIVPLSIENKPVGAISLVSSDSGRYYTDSDLEMAKELATRISLTMTNVKLYEDSKREIQARQQLEVALIDEKNKLESRVEERTKLIQLTNDGLREEIKKRHKVERELKEKSKNLERSNQELQDFAYVASHDLQEPLRKIQAFGDLLENEFGSKLGDGIDYLTRMRAAAARMSILIEDLLAFSRVTTKARQSSPIDLATVAREVISDLETRIKDTDGTVTIEPLPVVMADPTHMRQLLQNLIGNALKFHKPNTPAKVTVSSSVIEIDDTPMYEVRIKDNGIGFDEKYTDRIFSVFQRLHGRENYEGTGIGLAVCRKIAERYGGKIAAESKKGVGSTFIVTLPYYNEEQS